MQKPGGKETFSNAGQHLLSLIWGIANPVVRVWKFATLLLGYGRDGGTLPVNAAGEGAGDTKKAWAMATKVDAMTRSIMCTHRFLGFSHQTE